MRSIVAAGLVAICGTLANAPARAEGLPGLDWILSWSWVPPVKGNDTGGIIAYPLARQVDARQIAVAHCATYGKVAKFLSVDARYGGYISFSCRWVPYGPGSGR